MRKTKIKKAPRKTQIIDGQICSVRGVPLTRCCNTMTEREFIVHILSGLRRLTKFWKPKMIKKLEGRRPYTGTNKRIKWEYHCEACNSWVTDDNLELDHIKNCQGLKDIDDIPRWIRAALVEKEGYQRLCKSCHKTKGEEMDKPLKGIRANYHREESTYRNMMSRCYNLNATGYHNYGGRGITVCDYWKESFFNFYNDMGERPNNTSLDRIDNSAGYYKENCRWATQIIQCRNTSTNNYLTAKGKTQCVEEWAQELGIKANTLVYRVLRGWTTEEALEIVPRKKAVYVGRIGLEEIAEIIKKHDEGVSQTKLGVEYGIDGSQINRLYHRFKNSIDVLLQETNEEKL